MARLSSSSRVIARATTSRWREFRQRMVVRHKPYACIVSQVRSLTAQRFRKQKSRRIPQIESCRVELNELHIADFRARAKCHRDAIRGSDGRIGSVAIELTCTAGGQQHGRSVDDSSAGKFNSPDSATVYQAGGELKFIDRNIRQGLRLGVEGSGTFAPGGISMGVENAVAAVCTLAAEGQLGALAVEFRAPGDQFLNTPGSILH